MFELLSASTAIVVLGGLAAVFIGLVAIFVWGRDHERWSAEQRTKAITTLPRDRAGLSRPTPVAKGTRRPDRGSQ